MTKNLRKTILQTTDIVYSDHNNDVIRFDHDTYRLDYLSLSSMVHQLNRVLYENIPLPQCTTCLWHHLLHNKLIFDKNAEYLKIQKRYSIPYKDRLSERIVKQGINQLNQEDGTPYRMLIDSIYHHHRYTVFKEITRFVEMVVDILFALKRESYHSVEKALWMIHHSQDPFDQYVSQSIAIIMQKGNDPSAQAIELDRLTASMKMKAYEVQSLK